MASIRQVQANRTNAALSTGPRTDEGKARSRSNATRHGLAGEGEGAGESVGDVAGPEPTRSPAFERRLAEWASEGPTPGPAGRWALRRAVAASFQVERCEQALEAAIAHQRARALSSWDEDRAAEAAALASRLADDPIRVAAQLETSRAGVELLIRLWIELNEVLTDGHDWSVPQRSRALDLLGIPADGRPDRTLADPPEGVESVEHRRDLAVDEVERLQTFLEEAMIPLDEFERGQAERGESALLSKPTRLVLRYERDAWRRYRESMKTVRDPKAGPVPVEGPGPAPAPVPGPTPASPVGTKPMASQASEVDVTESADESGEDSWGEPPLGGVQGASRSIFQMASAALR